MKDALGREWQTGTFQLDFQLPDRFGCKYVDKDGKRLDQGGGSIILEGDVDNWAAAGHDAAYTIDGKDYHVTHAYEAGTGASRLIVNEIKWTSNDWPILTLPSEK